MSANAYLPQGNSLCVNASTTSVAMNPAVIVSSLLVTNRSTTSPLWVSWGTSSSVVAAFPIPGDPVGSQGIEVCPGMQVSIGTNGQSPWVAVVLLSGTGLVTITPGDGL